jgi:hypothetical protein
VFLGAVFVRKDRRSRIFGVGESMAIILVAAVAQMTLHGYLYGTPSLNGKSFPFLTARITADGPGLLYLERNCGQLHWAVCNHLNEIDGNPRTFLWDSEGVYQNSSASEIDQMSDEEIPLVLATVRAYPREQLLESTENFVGQLGTFSLHYSFFPLSLTDQAFSGDLSSYFRSRQAQNDLPIDFFTNIQWLTIISSLTAIICLIPHIIRNHSHRLVGLSLVITTMVVANACITGVLSAVSNRYQCRVIWLIPLLAGLSILEWVSESESQSDATVLDPIS